MSSERAGVARCKAVGCARICASTARSGRPGDDHGRPERSLGREEESVLGRWERARGPMPRRRAEGQASRSSATGVSWPVREGTRMSVYANGRTILHKGDGLTQTSGSPDVCKTPSPGGPVPIPYPNVAMGGDLVFSAFSGHLSSSGRY
jgi:hypothetical protein